MRNVDVIKAWYYRDSLKVMSFQLHCEIACCFHQSVTSGDFRLHAFKNSLSVRIPPGVEELQHVKEKVAQDNFL
jgi:hypothetical protein